MYLEFVFQKIFSEFLFQLRLKSILICFTQGWI